MTKQLDDRPRRKDAKRLPPGERRGQLLDAALDVLRHCALHELSMEAVAAAAGVGKPVLYTVFRTRAELVAVLLERERERAAAQVGAALPTDLGELGPTGAYAATVSTFVRLVLENPTSWRLILTVPDSAPSEYRDGLRLSRAGLLAQTEMLARAGVVMEPRLAGLDPALLSHTMLSFAEMLGRLAVTTPGRTPTSASSRMPTPCSPPSPEWRSGRDGSPPAVPVEASVRHDLASCRSSPESIPPRAPRESSSAMR